MRPTKTRFQHTLQQLLRWGSLFLVIAMVWGCLETDDSDNYDSVSDGDETSDGDSTDGDYQTDPAEGTVAVEFTPSSESGFPVQQRASINLKEFSGVFVLQPSISFTGEVRLPDESATEATLTLSPSDQNQMITGHSLPKITGSTNSLDDTASVASFALSILPDTLYTLYVYPKADYLAPPIVIHDGITFSEDTRKTYTFEQGLPLSGIVTTADGEPVPNVKVAAYDTSVWKRSSIAVSADSSNEGVSSDEEGRFTIYLSTWPGTYHVIFGPSSANPYLPEVVVSNAFSVDADGVTNLGGLDDSGELALQFDSFIYNTEQPPCIRRGVVKEGFDSNQPVASARLIFSNRIGGGTFDKMVTTDENGEFEIGLLLTDPENDSDAYRVTILPPVDSDASNVTLFDLECTSDGSEQLAAFELPKRLVFSGTVYDEDHRAVSGVEVKAKKKPTENSTNVYTKSAYTSTEGVFEMAIDEGSYDLTFLPPPNTGLARATVSDVQTSTNANIEQTLQEGQLFEGVVLDEQNNPVPWVYMEVFVVRTASSSSESIGSGSTDASGFFEIILP